MGELRKLKFGNAENVVTPYTAGDDTVIIDQTTKQIRVNTEEIATQEDITDVKEDLRELSDTVDGKVDDVQINGSSILDGGVANIPIGSSSKFGVVKPGYGLYIRNADQSLAVDAADSATIKGATSAYRSAPTTRQHESIFYGLTKAAGVDMAQSANPVGQYTDEAKIAIQKMLGIYEAPWELINDVTVSENMSELIIDTDFNGLPFELVDLIACCYFEISTTGSTSYITCMGEVSYKNGADELVLFPTLNNFLASSGFGYYRLDRYDDCYITVAQTQRRIGSTYDAGEYRFSNFITNVDYFHKFILRQYNSSSSLISAGTRIQLYGKRKWQ